MWLGARHHCLVVVVMLAAGVGPFSFVRAQEVSPAPGATPPATARSSVEKSTSDNKSSSSAVENQFDVKADNLGDRAALATFAKSVNVDFDRLLKLGGEWEVPIRINLVGGLGTDSGMQDSRTEVEYFDDAKAFTIVLHLKLPEGFSNVWLEREIVRVLLLEQMLSGDSADATASGFLQVPHWLTIGVVEAIAHRSKGRPSDMYSRLVRSRQMLPIEQLLNSSEAEIGQDSLSQSVFRASAGGLLEALLQQEDGEHNLCNWLAELPLNSENLTALFRQHFPSLRVGDASLAKWWALQVASMGQLQALEYYDVAATDEAIDAALQINMPSVPEGPGAGGAREGEGGAIKRVLNWFSGDDDEVFSAGRLHDFERFVDHPQAAVILEGCRRTLEAVKVRAFPLYRPVIDRYQAAAVRLMAGEKGGVKDLLAEGDKMRANIRSVMNRAEDYLNYYEATQVGERSEDFKAYRDTLDKLRKQKPKPRGDRISTHLDELEQEFK